MKHESTYKGRRFFAKVHSAPIHISLLLLTKIFLLFPAFLSCSDKSPFDLQEKTTTIPLDTKADAAREGRIDIYIYNNDKLGRLDSYSRLTYKNGLPPAIDISSRSGQKQVIALVNWPQEELDWGRMSSLESLCQALVYLDDEDPSSPRMSGSIVINAGVRPGIMSVSVLTARIRIEKITCNFEGRSYAGQKLENIKAYLTNVCTSSTLGPDSFPGHTYVNIGACSMGDMAAFGAPQLLYKEFAQGLESGGSLPGCDFYCYPIDRNTGSHPPTMLVIQGDLDGETYYYPIDICARAGGSIRRNTSYNLSIAISRLGSRDPDTPVSAASLETLISVTPWKDGGDRTQEF